MTTPQKLHFFSGIRKSLQVLLTQAERSRPVILYATPGLVLIIVLRTSLTVSGIFTLRLFNHHATKNSAPEVTLTGLTVYLALVILNPIILTPLDVMAVRLSIQRNYGSSGVDGSSTDIQDPLSEDKIIKYVFLSLIIKQSSTLNLSSASVTTMIHMSG